MSTSCRVVCFSFENRTFCFENWVVFSLGLCYDYTMMIDKYQKTHTYVKTTWQKARVLPQDSADAAFYVAPFVPPCVTGLFRVLFYWDTFYTNRGMLADGFLEYAKDNVDNLLAAVDRFGFVPNVLSKGGLKWCSQPPYLHFMIGDIYEATGDKEWLKRAYFTLKKEYAFWTGDRMTPLGLNRHYHFPLGQNDLVVYYDYIAENRMRIPKDIPEEEKAARAHGYLAAAEAGLDWSPRFRTFAADVIPVDLNANLYGLEKDLCAWSEMFEPQETRKFAEAMANRKRLMDAYCLGEDGLYHDYNYVTQKREDFYSSGQFMPFVTGMSADKRAVKRLLSALESAHGITSTQEDTTETLSYQWSYPNTWAPDNYLCVWALENCGMTDDAERVARKYLENVAATYEKTGLLWEKYDGVNGGVATKTEHAMTEMLGWSGGVYSCFYKQYYRKEK